MTVHRADSPRANRPLLPSRYRLAARRGSKYWPSCIPSAKAGSEDSEREGGEHAERERMSEIELAGQALSLGKENDIHAVRSGSVHNPVSTGRSRYPAHGRSPGVKRPCSRSIDINTLHSAGNPAVMAPRFRPVALRPRLSAGLPKISHFNMPNMARRNKRDGSGFRTTARENRTERQSL